MKPETLAIKTGHAANAVVPSIELATTYPRDAAYALADGRDYIRDKAATPMHAEHVLVALERGAAAMVFASGMAAATAAIRATCKPGDHVVFPRAGYYALREWLRKFAARWQLSVDFTADPIAALRPGATRLVWIETPANPTWEVTDIAAVASAAHAAGARVYVDSTCATPVHTRALELGADLVLHAATKYLAGHSDVLAGALVTAKADAEWAELAQLRREEGPCLGPVEAYLLLRGMRTLFVRVARQSATALSLARRLSTLPGVTVRYPWLPSHPQHAIASRQMTGGFGGMLSIETSGGAARALAVISKLTIWVPATSLGGVDSLVEHRVTVEGPTSPTPPDLLRLSVGLEHEDDLYDDLAAALA